MGALRGRVLLLRGGVRLLVLLVRGGVHQPLHAKLREGLVLEGRPRLWELRPLGQEVAGGRRPVLAQAGDAHGPRGRDVGPHGLPLEHGLRPRRVKSGPRLVESHGILAVEGVAVIHELSGVVLIEHMLSWEPGLADEERLSLLRECRRRAAPGLGVLGSGALAVVPGDVLLLLLLRLGGLREVRRAREPRGTSSRPGLVLHWHQGHLRRSSRSAPEVGVDVDVFGLLRGAVGGGRGAQEAVGVHLGPQRRCVHGAQALGQVRGDQRLWRGPMRALIVKRPPRRVLVLLMATMGMRRHPRMGLQGHEQGPLLVHPSSSTAAEVSHAKPMEGGPSSSASSSSPASPSEAALPPLALLLLKLLQAGFGLLREL